ncbi:hypothetical protein [Thalassoroseus pseudoceratinae]|uniref:hypothetical protein n=1 Tax=Thalassoroseus pseudoceratinae TaxID=2713176 RepID=UPI001420997A|nr:hypothetical protein [Thalassoroseus pseudoceratinae]
MGFASIVDTMLEEGRVGVTGPDLPDDVTDAAAVIENFEARYRLNLPGEPPQLSMAVALWAVTRFYQACQYLMFREIDANTVTQGLAIPCPTAETASVHYSVDLFFRFLPDLDTRVRAANAADVLAESLQNLANRWPLSSVGMKKVSPTHLDEVFTHPSLRLMYRDRVLSQQDWSRLDHEPTRVLVNEAIGGHPELAPEAVSAIADRFKESPPE